MPLTDGSVATVPIFDVKALLIAFLNDPLRMHQENLESNYDIFKGKAKLPTLTLDEIALGRMANLKQTREVKGNVPSQGNK